MAYLASKFTGSFSTPGDIDKTVMQNQVVPTLSFLFSTLTKLDDLTTGEASKIIEGGEGRHLLECSVATMRSWRELLSLVFWERRSIYTPPVRLGPGQPGPSSWAPGYKN